MRENTQNFLAKRSDTDGVLKLAADEAQLASLLHREEAEDRVLVFHHDAVPAVADVGEDGVVLLALDAAMETNDAIVPSQSILLFGRSQSLFKQGGSR